MKYKRNGKYWLILSVFAIVFIALGSMGGCDSNGGGGGGDDPLADADLIRGGLLYDRWWVVTGDNEPEGTNPTYPTEQNAMYSDPPRAGSQTWRCKECHGWDYLGVDGFYGPPSSHFTGIEGVFQVSEGTTQARNEGDHSPEELFDIIKFGIPGLMIGFGDFMSDDDIWDLVKFLLEGQIDDRLIVDYSSPGMNAVIPPFFLDIGELIYNDICAGCHGMDGEGLEAFGTEGISLNEIALDNPVEFIHKVRFGQPGTFMPSMVDLGYNTDDVKDLLAYAQEVLPNPPEPPPGEGCCVIAENDCVDDQTQAECDILGGMLEEGDSCSVVPACDVGPTPDGAALYADNCASCHGMDGEGGIAPPVIGESAQEINNAIMTVPLMMSLDFLSPEEIDAIAEFLAP